MMNMNMYPMPYMNYMQNMAMQYPYMNQMMELPEQKLEAMYPKEYYIIYPHVQRMCDNMEMQYGNVNVPNKEQLEEMADHITKQVEAEIKKEIEKEENENRQFGYGGRRLLGGLASILLIRELIRRRRPYGYGYGGGFGYPYGGFPGYYY